MAEELDIQPKSPELDLELKYKRKVIQLLKQIVDNTGG